MPESLVYPTQASGVIATAFLYHTYMLMYTYICIFMVFCFCMTYLCIQLSSLASGVYGVGVGVASMSKLAGHRPAVVLHRAPGLSFPRVFGFRIHR